MRVILDTNVFVSGAFFSGPPYQILAAWRDGRIRPVLSAEILEEYRRVGARLAGSTMEWISNHSFPFWLFTRDSRGTAAEERRLVGSR